MSTSPCPTPLFDTLKHLTDNQPDTTSLLFPKDYAVALDFLQAYDGSQATFNAYRREVERLLHWSWKINETSILKLKRQDIESYLAFCQNPPKAWIGTQKSTRFLNQDGLRVINPNWRPFVANVSKSEHRKGIKPRADDYELSHSALRDIFSILSSFYNFLVQSEITEINPVSSIRQKSKFIQRHHGKRKIRRLSNQQWDCVLKTAEKLANVDPAKHERTLFILSALYTMYLRISELISSDRWTPTMNDFWQDQDEQWWFTTVGKGNKERQITVSNELLTALKRWRGFLQLSSLPTPADHSPLVPKLKGKGPMSSTSHLREIVQFCFDQASEELHAQGEDMAAENLIEATVHWLRHTGISEDVKRRPREHVRDDAGHSSSAITDRYIDIELKERHASGKDKPIKTNDHE